MLEVRDVRFAYRQAPVLRGASLALAPGRITALVGPNGCGKSTLLRVAARLLVPQAGTVLLDGADVRALKPRAFARRVALLAQVPPPTVLTVEQVVLAGRYPHRGALRAPGEADRMAVARALARCRCEALRGKPVRELSGGERQRAYLALALAQDADILLLDEPTAHLDPAAGAEAMELVRALNHEEGKTVALVLHDLNLALRHADRVALLRDGRVEACLEVGDPALLEAIRALYRIEVRRFEGFATPYYCYEPIGPCGQ